MTSILFLVFALASVKADNPPGTELYYEDDMHEESLSRSTRSGIKDPARMWPQQTIPVLLDNETSAHYCIFWLVQAVNHIVGRTCIRFKPRSNQANYITVSYNDEEDTNCSRNVGMVGGRQEIRMGPACNQIRPHLHALLHAIGFYHEENRVDRYQFVSIIHDNIDAGNKSHFNKIAETCETLYGVPYDYKSVMHSARDAYSKNGLDTIVSLDRDVAIGEGQYLSDYDIKKINNMNCPGVQGVRFQNVQNGKYLDSTDFRLVDRVVVEDWNDNIEAMKWTVNWPNLKNSQLGSTIVSWYQYQHDVLNEVYALYAQTNTSYRKTEVHNVNTYWVEPDNFMWTVVRIENTSSTMWQIKHKRTGKCIKVDVELILGVNLVVQEECMHDEDQFWKIYNV